MTQPKPPVPPTDVEEPIPNRRPESDPDYSPLETPIGHPEEEPPPPHRPVNPDEERR